MDIDELLKQLKETKTETVEIIIDSDICFHNWAFYEGLTDCFWYCLNCPQKNRDMARPLR